MEIILIFLFSILFWLVVYMVLVYKNTNNKSDKDTNDNSDETTVEIGDVFVYEPLRIIKDPFEDSSSISDVDSRTYIIDDLKTNYEGVVWVKYHSLSSHRLKKCFYNTSSIDAFLWRTYKHNELKHLFE